MKIPDVFKIGMQEKQWKIFDGAQQSEKTIEADVIIIGSGAGGALAAEILSRAGRKVIIVEEGMLFTSSDFNLNETQAYQHLYQEGLTRNTKDGGITIMQGRAVGGSTVVNWTSSFRTPNETLSIWEEQFGLKNISEPNLSPWFSRIEDRLNIKPWFDANPNNSLLAEGCKNLGIPANVISRNVKGCWNLGYCGFGCPTNAKQSMLITSIPDALEHGASLFYRVRINRLIAEKSKIIAAEGICLDENMKDRKEKILLRAPLFIAASGAIGTPSLFLRSKLPDPHKTCGRRTFLHPTVFVFGIHPDRIDPYYGAPQSIHSDAFQWLNGVRGPMGFKLESSPLHPALASMLLFRHGKELSEILKRLPNTGCGLALMRDGFHEDSPGGTVHLVDDSFPVLDYPITRYLWEGMRRAHLKLAEIYFAARCQEVHVLHRSSAIYKSWSDAKQAIEEFSYEILRTRVGSAHVMGGAAMGENAKTSVVDQTGKHHHLDNLFVMDGSLFPTSIGANPQLSIYGIVAKLMHDFINDGKIYLSGFQT